MAFVNLGQIVYPVGSIYMSTISTSPASIFGGSWSRIEGAVLAANNGGYNTAFGGSKIISKSQLPHLEGQLSIHGGENGSILWTPTGVFKAQNTLNFYRPQTGSKIAGVSSIDQLLFSVGDNQPYYPYHYGVYCWRRTS